MPLNRCVCVCGAILLEVELSDDEMKTEQRGSDLHGDVLGGRQRVEQLAVLHYAGRRHQRQITDAVRTARRLHDGVVHVVAVGQLHGRLTTSGGGLQATAVSAVRPTPRTTTHTHARTHR